jgi:AcrR family transcriptional regulator
MNAFIFYETADMAGRREQQKEARKRRILRAASQLFETRGYSATGMSDIARRTRLAVGTLYNYFPAKPEIALAIVRAKTTEALNQGEALVKRPAADPVAAVAALVDLYIDTFSHFERDLWREVVAGAITDPAGLGVDFFAQDVRLMQQLDALLHELRSQGALDLHADPGRGAVTLYGVYISWFMTYLASDAITLETLRTQVHAGLALVMHGLVHPTPAGGRARKERSP